MSGFVPPGRRSKPLLLDPPPAVGENQPCQDALWLAVDQFVAEDKPEGDPDPGEAGGGQDEGRRVLRHPGGTP